MVKTIANMKKRFAIIVMLSLVFSGCASVQKIKMGGNASVGDNWELYAMSQEGVVDVSITYKIHAPIPGMSGTFTFIFKPIAEGEAEVVLANFFRGGRPRNLKTYRVVVDKWKNLKLEEIETRYPETTTDEFDDDSDYDWIFENDK